MCVIFGGQSEVEDTNAVVDYVCPNPQCNSRYTTFDFPTLLDRKTGRMICENCGSEVLEESANEGTSGKMEDRGKRRDVRYLLSVYTCHELHASYRT